MFLDRFLVVQKHTHARMHTHTHTRTNTHTHAHKQRDLLTNLSHNGLNPAHFPCWWVNNTELGEFCFTMIGRGDIEGSKAT